MTVMYRFVILKHEHTQANKYTYNRDFKYFNYMYIFHLILVYNLNVKGLI